MLRNIISVIIGLITAIITFVIAEYINHALYPFPQDIKTQNALQEYMLQLPLGYWLIILAGWFTGSLLSGILIQKISKSSNIYLSLIAGIVLTLSSIYNLFALPHPLWFSVLAVILFIPTVLLGNKLSRPTAKE
jgi:hypothetical protein